MNLLPVELMATASPIASNLALVNAGYFATLAADGCIRMFRLSDASLTASRVLRPAPLRLLTVDAVARGQVPWFGCVRDGAFHLLDMFGNDQFVTEVADTVTCCASASDGTVWMGTDTGDVLKASYAAPEEPSQLIASKLPRCVFVTTNHDETVLIVVHRAGALLVERSPGAERRLSTPEALGDVTSAAISRTSSRLVVGCKLGVVAFDITKLHDIGNQPAPPSRTFPFPVEATPATHIAITAEDELHWLASPSDMPKPLLFSAIVGSDSGALEQLSIVDLPDTVADATSVEALPADHGVAVGHSGGVWLSNVTKDDVTIATATSVVEAAAARAAEEEYQTLLEQQRAAHGRNSVLSRFAVDVCVDSQDIDDYRSEMNVYITAKLIGDLRPIATRLAIPATATARQILAVAEKAFDRRLSLGFTLQNGKVMEMRAASQKIFDCMPDEEKSLVCRPLFPGVALSLANHSSFNTSASMVKRAASAMSSIAPRSVEPSVITKTEEKSMIKRLYETSIAAHKTNVLRLEREVYPTQHFRTSTPTAETVQRLAGASARNRKAEAIERARAKCIKEGLIVTTKNVLEDSSEDDVVKRMYNERLKAVKEAEKRLDEQYSFKPIKSRVLLKTKEDWDKWHASMARDVRQTFRLPPDQMYYGKPSPRDRGHM